MFQALPDDLRFGDIARLGSTLDFREEKFR